MISLKEGKQLDNPSRLDMAKLDLACDYFSALTNGRVEAKIESIWMDYGARLWYKQIVIYNGNGSFQISPNDRQRIFNAADDADIEQAVMAAIDEYPRLYNVKED